MSLQKQKSKSVKTALFSPLLIALNIFIFKPEFLCAQAQETENFKLFYDWRTWDNCGGMLTKYLDNQAFEYLDKRDNLMAALKSRSDWEKRRDQVKNAYLKNIGTFPEKNPLNTIITGTLKKSGYHVEKIVFESIPGYHVTGSLFIPEGINEKRPAVLYVSGHSQDSYKSVNYQIEILNLVKKGFVVFAIDPIGQGERVQYYDPGKKASIIGTTTIEHTYAGLQCLLNGTSVAKYFIWDGIRAIDYLITRPEVDPDRIGVTGRSGGGTQTVYISAFDDRVLAAAPENYVTSHRRLLESRGPQDGEQNFYHWLAQGLALEDLLVARMPKPTILITTTRDIFSIQGAREVFQEITKGYKAMGKDGDFQMVEDHAEHSTTLKNREALYQFFQKYLALPGNPNDEKVEILPPVELQVTKTGQVSDSYQGETVFSLNKKESDKLYNRLQLSRQNNKNHLSRVKENAMALSGFIAPDNKVKAIYRGSHQREGYTIGMYAIEAEGGYIIPLLVAVPDGDGKYPAMIYLHPDGKEEGIVAGGKIEKLVKQGYVVAAPDLIGIGETKPNIRFPAVAALEAMLLGRSIVGIQAGDIAEVANFLKNFPKANANQISAVAFGEQCPSLLHAAAFEPSITGITVIEPPISYYDIACTRFYGYINSFSWGVAGALTAYDLPDLAASLIPRKLTYIRPMDGQKKAASPALIEDQLSYPKSVYGLSSPGSIKILQAEADEAFNIFLNGLSR